MKLSVYSIKDKNNLFNTTVWTGGELNQQITYNTDYLTPNINFNPVNEWQSNGDKSWKCTGETWIRFIAHPTQEDLNKTITCKAKVYLPQGTCRTHLITTTPQTYSDITQGISTIYLTAELTEESPIYFNFQFTNCDLIYIDDLECYIQ